MQNVLLFQIPMPKFCTGANKKQQFSSHPLRCIKSNLAGHSLHAISKGKYHGNK